jgi:hypothetical protein
LLAEQIKINLFNGIMVCQKAFIFRTFLSSKKMGPPLFGVKSVLGNEKFFFYLCFKIK